MNCTKQIYVRDQDKHCCVHPGIRFLGFLLALCCALLLIGYSFQVNAIATETVIISGLIAAYCTAVGVEFFSNNSSNLAVKDLINSLWDSYCYSQNISNQYLNDKITIIENKLRYSSEAVSVLNDFIGTLNTSDNNLGATVTINGQNFNYWNETTFNGNSIPFNTTVSVICNDGLSHNFYVEYNSVDGFSGKLYIDGVRKSFSGWTQAYYDPLPVGWFFGLWYNQYVNIIQFSNFIAQNQHEYYKSIADIMSLGDLCPKVNSSSLDINVENISSDLPTSETYIDYPNISENDSIDDVSNNIINDVIENNLTVSFNTPSIPTINTGYGFIDSINGIWKYVVHLFNEAAAGITFIGDVLSMFPTEISWCFYGVLVLLIFSGVISKLLQ